MSAYAYEQQRQPDDSPYTGHAAALMFTHDVSHEGFELATTRALAFTASYPDDVYGAGREHSDSEMVIAYQGAFGGIRQAVHSERVRRSFAQALFKQVPVGHMEAAATSPGPASQSWSPTLMLEALHATFPDELGEPDQKFEVEALKTAKTSALYEWQFRVETAGVDEFQGAVDELLDRAGTIERAIKLTNNETSRIVLYKNASGRVVELDLSQHDAMMRQTRIRRTGVAYYMNRTTEYYEHSRRRDRELNIVTPDFDATGRQRRLRGSAGNSKASQSLNERVIIDAVNNTFQIVGQELKNRQVAAGARG